MTQNQIAYMGNLERIRDDQYNNMELSRINSEIMRNNAFTNIESQRHNVTGEGLTMQGLTNEYFLRRRANEIQSKSVDNAFALGNQANTTNLVDISNRNANAQFANMIQNKDINNRNTNAQFANMIQQTNVAQTQWNTQQNREATYKIENKKADIQMANVVWDNVNDSLGLLIKAVPLLE